MANKRTRFTTAAGTCIFANVFRTEHFKDPKSNQLKDTGEFTIQVHFNEKDADALRDVIQKEWDKFKETLTPAQQKSAKEPNFKEREYQDVSYFKFTLPSVIKCQDGSEWKRTVAIFDAKKNDIFKDIEGIGNGSKVRIACELSPFFMSKANYGVSLRLVAIQVIDLKAFGNESAEAFGFDSEDGYVSENQQDSDALDEVPAESPEDEDF